MSANEDLERKVAATPDDATARYELAVLLLSEFGRTYEPDLLDRARDLLSHAIALRPKHARSHALLGHTYDLTEGGAKQALHCFHEARRLDPADKEIDVYVLTLLQETGRDEEAIAAIEVAAARHDVDIDRLRQELADAGFPADPESLLANGFIHARNFFRSSLEDEAERIMNKLERGRKRKLALTERERCRADQQDLEASFDASRVPEALRALAPSAARYGVGDDYCRPLLLKQLSKARREKLIREVDASADAIHTWLDSFGDREMPVEPAAFMYLFLGVEEIR